MARNHLRSLPGVAEDIGWEAVALVDIHQPILAIPGSLLVTTGGVTN